jgi:predicted GNAT superfamily acetyltransferase
MTLLSIEQKKLEPTINDWSPAGFGFKEARAGLWHKELNGETETFEVVDWKNIPALEEVVDMQQRVWGMGPRDAVPSNLLAIAGDTGGSIITARNDQGVMEGFVFTTGVIDGSLILHMIGVDEARRYKKDLGWNLSVLQLFEAQRKGVSRIAWTFDPMRGSNARLNLEKLGAVVNKFTVNKYGRVASELYGESPTDRFTAEWDINDEKVVTRLKQIADGSYVPKGLADITEMKILTEPLADITMAPDEFLVEIPYDIDSLEEKDKIIWRMNLRNILTSVLDTESASSHSEGEFMITGLASGRLSEEHEKQSFYILSRK